MKETFYIGGTTPADEECASVGDADYSTRARKEGRAFIAQIRRQFQDQLEKMGDRVELKLDYSDHDLDPYYHVIALVNEGDDRAFQVAIDIENDVATRWDSIARAELGIVSEEDSEKEKREYANKFKDFILGFYNFAIYDEEKDFIASDAKAWSKAEIPTYFSLDYFVYGDYTGDLVNKANHEAMEEILNKEGIEYEVDQEAYSTYSLLIPFSALENETVKETLEGLQDYPLIDEEKHSELEEELRQESWDSYGRQDFENALTETFEIQLSEMGEDFYLSDEMVDELAYEASNHTSEGYGHYESVNDYWFDIKGMIRALKKLDIRKLLKKVAM